MRRKGAKGNFRAIYENLFTRRKNAAKRRAPLSERWQRGGCGGERAKERRRDDADGGPYACGHGLRPVRRAGAVCRRGIKVLIDTERFRL